MNALSHRWMTTLRRWRRAILLASLPTVLASALSAGACVAMPATPVRATPAPAAAEPEHHHHTGMTDAQAAPEPAAPCPHCPFESGAANTATLDCASTEARDGAPAASAEPPTLPPTSRAVAAAQAIPPLIHAAPTRASPLPAGVSLNVRYCVFLI